MNNETIAALLNALLYVLMIAAPAVLAWLLKGFKYMKEAGDLLTVVGMAIEDGTFTKEEIAAILKEAKDLKEVEVKMARHKSRTP